MEKDKNKEFIEKARKVHGDKYDYSKVEYIDNATKVRIICPEHGEFMQRPYSHLNGNGCPECAGLKKWDTPKFIEKAREVHGDRYDYSKSVYVNKRTKLTIICPIHGEFTQTPANHIRQQQGCPVCGKKYASEWRKNDYEHYIEESRKRFGDIYEYPNIENEYINSHSLIHFKCKKCGNIFEKIACDHLTSPHGGCLKCYANKSKGEEEIIEYIQSLIGSENVVVRTRSVLHGQELDIYIPKLKLAFEFNGLYWHCDEKKDKNYHLQKTEACEHIGIRLIQIFEDEYSNHKEIVLNKIRHILYKDGNKKKAAGRKCIVKKIETHSAKNFLEKFHIQGFAPATIYLGAFLDEKLVAVMSFLSRKGNWELNRFASDYDYTCVGVGGKLFTYFINTYNPDYVKSFADRRWTSLIEENLYTKIGFKQEKILLPDYKYIETRKNVIQRIHKFNFRKKVLCKKYHLEPGMTESDMTKQLNIHRIYDCGLIKYIWRKEK